MLSPTFMYSTENGTDSKYLFSWPALDGTYQLSSTVVLIIALSDTVWCVCVCQCSKMFGHLTLSNIYIFDRGRGSCSD
jgi:hypothetical protein